jgi:hypothetical protein
VYSRFFNAGSREQHQQCRQTTRSHVGRIEVSLHAAAKSSSRSSL